MRYLKLGLVVLLSVVTTLAILAHSFGLLRASWDAMTKATGTTTLGFVVYVIVLTALGSWLVSVLVEGVTLYRANTPRAFQTAVAKFSLLGVVLSVLLLSSTVCLFGTFLAATIYADHQTLRRSVETLTTDNLSLKSEIETRKHNLFTTDPVFSNVNGLLMAFDVYRHALKDAPCVLKVTAPQGAGPLAMVVPQFSNSVSGCFTFGPMPASIDPDADTETMNGMEPGVIIFHAPKDDAAANELFDRLSNLLPLKRSYQQPTANYRLPTSVIPPHVVWLQFGTKTVWNTELRR